MRRPRFDNQTTDLTVESQNWQWCPPNQTLTTNCEVITKWNDVFLVWDPEEWVDSHHHMSLSLSHFFVFVTCLCLCHMSLSCLCHMSLSFSHVFVTCLCLCLCRCHWLCLCHMSLSLSLSLSEFRLDFGLVLKLLWGTWFFSTKVVLFFAWLKLKWSYVPHKHIALVNCLDCPCLVFIKVIPLLASYGNITSTRLPWETVWTPDIVLYNAAGDGEQGREMRTLIQVSHEHTHTHTHMYSYTVYYTHT